MPGVGSNDIEGAAETWQESNRGQVGAGLGRCRSIGTLIRSGRVVSAWCMFGGANVALAEWSVHELVMYMLGTWA